MLLGNILGNAGLTESSDEGAAQPPESIYGGKSPKPRIRENFEKQWRQLQKDKKPKAATGKQAMGNQGRGKVGIDFNHPMVHRYDHEVQSGDDSSEPEILSTPSEQGSSKRKIKSIPRHERIVKKSKKSEKEMSIHESREM